MSGRGVILACVALAVLAAGALAVLRRGPASPSAGNAGAGAGGAGVPRVVVLSPAAGIILTDLGLRDTIVARHAYDAFLPETLPIAGDQSGIDYEPLLRTQPTHVITQWGSRELPARLTDLAERHKWRLLDVRLLTMTDVAEQTLALDRFVRGGGVSEEAGSAQAAPSRRALELSQRARELAQPAGAAEAGIFAGRVLLLASLDPPAALGPGSCHHDILLSLGGVPAVREGRPWMELSREDLLLLAPEAIVLVRPRPPGVPRPAEGAAREEQAREAFQAVAGMAIPAVREGRLALLDDPRGLMPSTAMLPLAEELRGLLRRWGAEAPDAESPR